MRLLPALTLAIALISTASAQIQMRPPYPVSTEAEAIKQQIIQICLANQTRTDNWPQVRTHPAPHRTRKALPSRRQLVPGLVGRVFLPAHPRVLHRSHQGLSDRLPRLLLLQRQPAGQGLGNANPVPQRGLHLQPLFTKYVSGPGRIPDGADVTTYAMWAEAGLYDAQPLPSFEPSLFPKEALLINQ